MIELLDFTTDHTYEYPKEDASEEDKIVGKALLEQKVVEDAGAETKRSPDRAVKRAGDESETSDEPLAKKRKPEDCEMVTTMAEDVDVSGVAAANATPGKSEEPRPVAVKVRMTVGSGFYVRSFVHE